MFHINQRKFPDRPHYRHQADPLGADARGRWFSLPAGRAFMRDDELLFRSPVDGVGFIPNDEWWMAWFPDGGEFDLYVDIITPPRWEPDQVTVIDLDLDVIRYRDGRIELADEDEFEEHRVAFEYPAPVIEGALRSAREVMQMVGRGGSPFDESADLWRRRRPALGS